MIKDKALLKSLEENAEKASPLRSQANGLALAFLGDAVYDVGIRRYLLEAGLTKPNRLHRKATQYVSAKAQAKIAQAMIDRGEWTEEELAVFKRGRNAKSHTSAKNSDIVTYRIASGFEAVMGYLSLDGQEERLEELIQKSIEVIEINAEKGKEEANG